MSTLLVLSGSSRSGSLNRRLAGVAARAARAQGATVTELDLRGLGLPVYDADIEAQGLPPGALTLRQAFAAHAGVLIASPEYNAFVPPLLLNALDWTSRVPASADQPAGMAAMNGKIAGLLSASPGALGGLRGLIFLRAFLSASIGMVVVPQTHSVGQAHQAFDAQDQLVDAKQQAAVERVVGAVLALLRG